MGDFATVEVRCPIRKDSSHDRKSSKAQLDNGQPIVSFSS